jgi:hypothetical protein
MNPETLLTLDDCVGEVLGLLTGLDLTYDPRMDRYRAVVRQLNRALRSNALEKEWSYYSDVEEVGTASAGETMVQVRSSLRPRIVNDDAVRLVAADGCPVRWAYFLPRDALHKYRNRGGLWCSVTRNTIEFSRPFTSGEDGLSIQVPVMREPRMFRLPAQPEDENASAVDVPEAIRNQPLDFPYPDLVTLRAAFYYAQTDPVMQPRVQTIEAQYKDLMYQIIERDDRNTDSPLQNEFFVPVQNSLHGHTDMSHLHPHADERLF